MSLGLGLVVGQNKTFEDITLDTAKQTHGHILLFLTFYRQNKAFCV